MNSASPISERSNEDLKITAKNISCEVDGSNDTDECHREILVDELNQTNEIKRVIKDLIKNPFKVCRDTTEMLLQP